jgi:flagellar basal-body rod protein FlgC
MMKTSEPRAFFNLNISHSGLASQRRRMDAISENLANVNTTRGKDGGPFKPRVTVMHEGELETSYVKIQSNKASNILSTSPDHIISSSTEEESEALHGVRAEIMIQNRRPRMEYDPDHPDADADGYVAYPDINVVEEMTNLIAASRSYEANLTAIAAAKDMAAKALEI